jgi:hypothetical protein
MVTSANVGATVCSIEMCEGRLMHTPSHAHLLCALLQALLDLYTIQRELGRLDGFKIAMIGDLLNGRTVHSLAYLLSKFEDVEMVFVSPEILRLKPPLKAFLSDAGVKWREEEDLLAAVSDVDVLYQTRIQKERFLVSSRPCNVLCLHDVSGSHRTRLRVLLWQRVWLPDVLFYEVGTSPLTLGGLLQEIVTLTENYIAGSA